MAFDALDSPPHHRRDGFAALMAAGRRTVVGARCAGKCLAAALCTGAAALCTGAMAAAAPALPTASSTLSLGPRGVQSLVAEQLFNREGRWYLIDDEGVCYTYLESPHVRLAADRLVLKAHMVSRLGQRFGSNCIGADLASNVTVSGKVRGTGQQLILDDIRIDHIDNEAARNALNLAVQVAPDSIPRTTRIDVLESLRKQAFTAGSFAVHVDEIHIASITTRNDTLVIQFDLSMSAP
jgi:hypothetical protein